MPTPSASTGWHSVGVINCLSLQSGTPSPSVSLVTPCVSTGQPAGVLASLSKKSQTPSPSVSSHSGFGTFRWFGEFYSLYA